MQKENVTWLQGGISAMSHHSDGAPMKLLLYAYREWRTVK